MKKSKEKTKNQEKSAGSGSGRKEKGPDQFNLNHMLRIFESCGLELTAEAAKRFWEFHQLLRTRNEELDLTRLRSFESMVLKHYVDSVLVTKLLDLPGPLLDLGSGAGFPGIPIKIVRPDLPIILAESRGKRLEFLEEAIDRLGLTEVEIHPHKVFHKFDRPIRGIITRDLESIVRTLDRAFSFLPQGGQVIFMKGPEVQVEIEEARKIYADDFRLITDRSYRLGSSPHRRRLLVFERTSAHPSAEEPRSNIPTVTEIASVANPRFKAWQKILEARGIKKHETAIISGRKMILEVLADFPHICLEGLERGSEEPLVSWPADMARFRLRPEIFRHLDLFGTGPPLLVVKVPPILPWIDLDWPAGCTLFIPFQDPANVGAVIRSAAAFGVGRVVLLKEAAHPFHPRSLRAAGSTVFRVPIFHGPALADLKKLEGPFVGLSPRGRSLFDFRFPEKFGLVPGLEGPGLTDVLPEEQCLAIPMARGVESLNAAQATGIALYEWQRNLKIKRCSNKPGAN